MQRIGPSVFLAAFFLGVLSIVWLTPPRWLSVYLLVLAGACLLVGIRIKHIPLRLIAVCLLGVGVAWVRIAGIESTIPDSFVPLLERSVVLEGVVVALPDVRESATRLTVAVSVDGSATNIIASVPGYPRVRVGDKVEVSGKLTLPEPFDGDGGRTFAYDQYLRKEGVYGIIQPARIEVVGKDTGWRMRFMRTLESARVGFMHSTAAALPEPQSALAVGLIAGGKQGLGEELIEAFTIAGLLQIVVLSGYNVMVIANGIQRALSFLPHRVGAVLACVSIACFVLSAGGGSPALRAGLMALVCIIAKAFGSGARVLQTLFLTLFLLVLWNPLLLVYDPGLQFSFLATLGLVLGTPIIESRLSYIRNDTFRELLASSLAAQIGVMPILLWQTGNLSLVAVVANIIVTPVIPIAMATSAIAAAIAFIAGESFWVLAAVSGIPAYLFLSVIITVARVSAALPYAQVIVPAFGFAVVPLAYAGLGFVVWRSYQKRPISIGEGRFESMY